MWPLFKGNLMHKTKQLQAQMIDNGYDLNGAQLYWMLYHAQPVTADMQEMYDLRSLEKIKLHGDNLPRYNDEWDAEIYRLAMNGNLPKDMMKLSYMQTELEKSHQFSRKYTLKKEMLAEKKETLTYDILKSWLEEYLAESRKEQAKAKLLHIPWKPGGGPAVAAFDGIPPYQKGDCTHFYSYYRIRPHLFAYNISTQ